MNLFEEVKAKQRETVKHEPQGPCVIQINLIVIRHFLALLILKRCEEHQYVVYEEQQVDGQVDVVVYLQESIRQCEAELVRDHQRIVNGQNHRN